MNDEERKRTNYAILARRMVFLSQFKPFEYPFEGRTAMAMQRLLFGIGYHTMCGYPDLSIRHACVTYAGMSHPITTKNMVRSAQEIGYITLYENLEKDGRRKYIRPADVLLKEFNIAIDRLFKNTEDFWSALRTVDTISSNES